MGRKQKKYHFIYKTTNVLSGKYYIGMHSTDKLDDGYLGSGTRLRRSINKYGKENFKREILEFVETRKLLKQLEEAVVTLDEIAKVDCMNLKVGGYGGFTDEAHRIKCQKAGYKAMFKKLNSDKELRKKTSLKISESIKRVWENGGYKRGLFEDKNHSNETKQKMSEAKKGTGKGSKNSQFGSCWITNEVDNKKIKRGDEIPKGWRLGRKSK